MDNYRKIEKRLYLGLMFVALLVCAAESGFGAPIEWMVESILGAAVCLWCYIGTTRSKRP